MTYEINLPGWETASGVPAVPGTSQQDSVSVFELLCVLVAELRKQEETGQLVQPVLFVLLVLVSVLLYFAVSLMDPGFILSDDSDLQVINDPNIHFCYYHVTDLCQNGWY